MTTAVIGIGHIGEPLARQLVAAGERLILAADHVAKASALAKELGPLATAEPVRKAIADADVIVFAVPFETIKQLIRENADLLPDKVVIDPSNAVRPDGKGGFERSLPDGQSAGATIAALLPARSHFVKAFGTLSAGSLASGANRKPERAVLFYATDDPRAALAAERLIAAAGFDPVKANGVRSSGRIEMLGDLHEFGGLNGKLLTAREAADALAGNRKEKGL